MRSAIVQELVLDADEEKLAEIGDITLLHAAYLIVISL